MSMPYNSLLRIAIAIFVAAILAFLLGCAPCCSLGDLFRDKNDTTCTVKGTAYINASGVKTPVPNVDVQIGSRTGKTDSNGSFEITGLNPGTYTVRVFGGDLGYTEKIHLTTGETLDLGDVMMHPTLPPPDTSDESGTYPDTAEGVIQAYYKAINNKDYDTALKYLAGQMSGMTVDGMQKSYGDYISSVSVSSITREEKMDYDGRTIYSVVFSAEYIKHYPAGSTNLPTVHAMKQIDGQWKIVEIGTG
jgi:hypothetical protein